MPEQPPPLGFDADSIVDTVREPLLVLDADLRVQRANRSFFHAFQVTPEQTENRLVYDLGDGQWNIPRLRTLLEEILPQKTFFEGFEVEHDFPGVGRKVMLLNARCIDTIDDHTRFILLAIEDVTQRRRAEEERRELETRFTSLVKNIKDHAIFTMDTVGRITSWNVEAGRILGYSEEEILGKNFSIVFTPEDVQQGLPEWELRTAIEQGRAEDERWHLRKGGERFWALGIVTRTQDAEGKHTGYSKILRDMTERKHAEEEGRFHSRLLDAVGQAIVVTDPDGTITYWNRSAETLYGWPKEEVLGRNVVATIAGLEEAGRAAEVMGRLRAGESWSGEFVVRRRDGTTFPALVSDVPLFDEEGRLKALIGVSSDISEQKRAEQTARFLADASAILAALVDYESTLQKVARLAVPFFADWAAVDMMESDGSLRRVAVAHVDRSKVELAQEMNRRFPPDPAAPQGLWNILRTGQPEIVPEITDALLVERVKDEELLRIMRELGLKSYMGVPLKVRGKAVGVITFLTAESGRRYAAADLAVAADLAYRAGIAIENAQLYRALKDADRRKDEFLAVLAHELRNPLAPLVNALQIMRLTAKNDQAAELRNMMERQVRQITRLVDDLLDVSRIATGKIVLRKERIDLAEVMLTALETSRPLIEAARHELTITPPPNPLWVEADKTRLAQVLSNLLTNSTKYTPEGGHIRLTVERQGQEALIRVRDNGMGIPKEMLPKIFDMFTQVDRNLGRSEGGLGIGLTLVRSLAELHGGSVEARSDGPGRGSEFIVHLPLAPEEPPRQGEQADQDAVPPVADTPAGRRILVVDDNVDSAESLAMMLKLQGNEVCTVHDGLKALEAAAAFSPGVVLLAIGLPEIDGYEVARRMRQMPALQGAVLIAQTGWGQDEDRRRSSEAGFDHHFVKPVDAAALQKLLASLDAPAK